MPRNCSIRSQYFTLAALTALIVGAGCSHPAQKAAPSATAPVAEGAAHPAAPVPSAAPVSAAEARTNFQPYTLLPPPPASPPPATHKHRVLHLTHVRDRVYLTDSDRHLYEAGRDAQGHIYPVYRDSVTHAAYPLYYDPARDNLYRLARTDDGRFYRNFVGQPGDYYYRSDRDYERTLPAEDDRPVVTDADSATDYNATPYVAPPAHQSSHHNNDWLWAIPVVIGAYLLLRPHHHSSPPPPALAPVIVRRSAPITIINQGGSVVSRPVPAVTRPVAKRSFLPLHRPPTILAVHAPGTPHVPGYIAPIRPFAIPRPHPVAPARPVMKAPRKPLRPASPVAPHPVVHPQIAPRRMIRPVRFRPMPVVTLKHPEAGFAAAKHVVKAKPAIISTPHPVTLRPVPLRRLARPRRPMVRPQPPRALQPHLPAKPPVEAKPVKP